MMRVLTALFALTFSGVAQATASPSELIKGKVIGVPAGDTVVIRSESGATIEVRLAGIDSPDIGQVHSRGATDFTKRQVILKEVSLVPVSELQSNQMYVGYLKYEDDRDLGADLLKAGYGWARGAPDPSVGSRYSTLEREAREGRLGLWKDPIPQSPWDYRAATSHHVNVRDKARKKEAAIRRVLNQFSDGGAEMVTGKGGLRGGGQVYRASSGARRGGCRRR